MASDLQILARQRNWDLARLHNIQHTMQYIINRCGTTKKNQATAALLTDGFASNHKHMVAMAKRAVKENYEVQKRHILAQRKHIANLKQETSNETN